MGICRQEVERQFKEMAKQRFDARANLPSGKRALFLVFLSAYY